MKASIGSVLVVTALAIFLAATHSNAQGTSSGVGASLPDNDAQAKARAALYGEAEPAPQEAPSTETAPSEPTPSRETRPAPVSETSGYVAYEEATGPVADTEAQAKARAALSGLYSQPPQRSAPAETTGQASAAPVAAPATVSTVSAPPASPLSSSTQQQLAVLLQQYQTDAISASEYHRRRAELLGE